jgi:glyoxylase-like metal-dependent hydrolase (beta-lactamase superfamily II)
MLRRLAAVLAVPLAVLAAGCAAAVAVVGPAAPVALKLADGVYMLQGAAGEADAGTLGRVGNAGFIVGDSGVIAIDTGVSYRHGMALLQAIAKVTDKPIRLALITQTHQEFLFGAAAFRERGIPIHMHRKTAELMASRCENCLKTLKRVLGEDEMRGTTMFKPDQVFDAGLHETPLLSSIGRPVQVLYFGHSSGPGDIAVLDTRSGVLFAGALVDHLRIPDVQDSELPTWHAALTKLRALPLQRVVPGHGPAATADSIAAVQRYLTQLEARVLELLRSGAALSDVPDAAELAGFKDWDQYDIVHRRNASVLFVRMEREQMFK